MHEIPHTNFPMHEIPHTNFPTAQASAERGGRAQRLGNRARLIHLLREVDCVALTALRPLRVHLGLRLAVVDDPLHTGPEQHKAGARLATRAHTGTAGTAAARTWSRLLRAP